MLISKEKHYNLKDLSILVKLLSCAVALFWEAHFILFPQFPNPTFNLPHPPWSGQDNQVCSYITSRHKHSSEAWRCVGVASSCTQVQLSTLRFPAGRGSLLWWSVPTQDYQWWLWQSDPEQTTTWMLASTCAWVQLCKCEGTKPALFANKIVVHAYKASHFVLLHYCSHFAKCFPRILVSQPYLPPFPRA